jgi:hypothetical protein
LLKKQIEVPKAVFESNCLKRLLEGKPSGTRRKGQCILVTGPGSYITLVIYNYQPDREIKKNRKVFVDWAFSGLATRN